MGKDEEILTKKEQLINLIFSIFCIIVCMLAVIYLYTNIGELYTLIFICIFCYFAIYTYNNIKKFINKTIEIQVQINIKNFIANQ